MRDFTLTIFAGDGFGPRFAAGTNSWVEPARNRNKTLQCSCPATVSAFTETRTGPFSPSLPTRFTCSCKRKKFKLVETKRVFLRSRPTIESRSNSCEMHQPLLLSAGFDALLRRVHTRWKVQHFRGGPNGALKGARVLKSQESYDQRIDSFTSLRYPYIKDSATPWKAWYDIWRTEEKNIEKW